MEQFWLVWNERGSVPVYKHPTEQSARNEAERLAKFNSGKFHVLALIGTCKKVDVQWENVPNNDPDDIPI